MLSSDPDSVESPELDAMDYRSEYSMMNDAKGAATVSQKGPVLEVKSSLWEEFCPAVLIYKPNFCHKMHLFSPAHIICRR